MPHLPKPTAVVMAYTGHSDFSTHEPSTFVVVGERDGIASPSLSQRAVEHRIARPIDKVRKDNRVLVGQRRGESAVDRPRDCLCNEDSGADRQPPSAVPREDSPVFHRSARLDAGRLTIALQALEVRADLAGVLIAKLPILFQALVDDALQFLRQPGIQSSPPARARDSGCRRRSAPRCRRETVARQRPFRTTRCRTSKRAGVKVLRSHLLGRHVRDRSKRAPRTRQAVDRRHGRRGVITAASCSDLGQPEIENLRVSARGNEEICRLDVAVDDAGRVRCFERVGDLDRQRGSRSISNGRPAI